MFHFQSLCWPKDFILNFAALNYITQESTRPLFVSILSSYFAFRLDFLAGIYICRLLRVKRYANALNSFGKRVTTVEIKPE